MNAIEVKNLTKKFDDFVAVNNISFTVESGEVFGFLGHNGAGKTTTIRMLTGIIEPSGGSAVVGGYDITKDPIKAKQLLGIIPEMANVYVDFTVIKNLILMGELYGLTKNKIADKATELLELFGLDKKRNDKAKTLSKGLKQRLIVAMGMMNEPKILFLDEPTSGLDVASVRLIRKLIRELNRAGVTIFLTTHNIEEAGQLCDRIAIMNHGEIAAIEQPEKLKQLSKSAVAVEIAFDHKIEKEELNFDGVDNIEKIGDKFRLDTKEPAKIIPLLAAYAQSSDNKIVSINTLSPSLEDIFLEIINNEEM